MDKQEKFSIIDNFKDFGIDMSETALDSFLEDGIIKEIPIINLIFASFKTGKQVIDYVYLKKLAAFMFGYEKALPKRMDERILKIIKNPAKLKGLGEDIMLIIDKADKIAKAELHGKIFKLYWYDEIPPKIFLRLCHMINNSYYDDLLFLNNFTDDNTRITSYNKLIEETIIDGLFSSGWLSNFGIAGGDDSGGDSGTIYGLNEYSKILKRVL